MIPLDEINNQKLIRCLKKLQYKGLCENTSNPQTEKKENLLKIFVSCIERADEDKVPNSVLNFYNSILIRQKDPETCDGPMIENCRKCATLKKCTRATPYTTRIPQSILDFCLKNLSNSAFKVFMYLNRKANFDPNSEHFGRCWPSREKISEATGVSKNNMSKYLIELEKILLIRRSEPQRFRKPDGQWGSSSLITVTWFQKWKRFGLYGNRVVIDD